MANCKVGSAMEQNLDHLTSVVQKVKKATPQGGVAFFGVWQYNACGDRDHCWSSYRSGACDLAHARRVVVVANVERAAVRRELLGKLALVFLGARADGGRQRSDGAELDELRRYILLFHRGPL